MYFGISSRQRPPPWPARSWGVARTAANYQAGTSFEELTTFPNRMPVLVAETPYLYKYVLRITSTNWSSRGNVGGIRCDDVRLLCRAGTPNTVVVQLPAGIPRSWIPRVLLDSFYLQTINSKCRCVRQALGLPTEFVLVFHPSSHLLAHTGRPSRQFQFQGSCASVQRRSAYQETKLHGCVAAVFCGAKTHDAYRP